MDTHRHAASTRMCIHMQRTHTKTHVHTCPHTTHLVITVHLASVLALEGGAQADGDALTDEGEAAQKVVLV